MVVVFELGVAVVSAAGVLVTILSHWFTSPDSEHDRQETLRQELVDVDAGWTESEKGNKFNLTITGIEVRESDRLLYRLCTKPLPILGGFAGETAVTTKIEGDVRLEEWALIEHIATSSAFQGMVADFQLTGDELVFVLNTADEDEIRTPFTGVVRAIQLNDRYLADDTVRHSDHKTLGKPVGGGVARPLFVDVAFPTRPVSRLLTWPLKNVIQYGVGSMERSFVWVRQTPMRRTSTTEFRVRYPNQNPVPKDLAVLDWLYLFLSPERCSEGGVAVLQMLHMGYRLHRDFVEDDEVTETNGATCLVVSIAQLQEDGDIERTRPTRDDLLTGFLVLNDFWGLVRNVDAPRRTRIEIPVDNVDPHAFEELDLTTLSPADRTRFNSLLSSNEVMATAITGLGNGLVQAYYHGGDGSWNVTVRWSENGNATVQEIGSVEPETPVNTNGYVIWQKHHPGSQTSYAPNALNELRANLHQQE